MGRGEHHPVTNWNGSNVVKILWPGHRWKPYPLKAVGRIELQFKQVTPRYAH